MYTIYIYCISQHTEKKETKKAVDLDSAISNIQKSVSDSEEAFSPCFVALYPVSQLLMGPSGPNITC